MKNSRYPLLRISAAYVALLSFGCVASVDAQPLRQALPGYSVIGDSTKTDPKASGPNISAPSMNGYSSNGSSWRGQSQGSHGGGSANNNVRSRNTAAPGASALSSLKPAELKKLAADALRFENEGLAEEKKGNLNGALLKLKQSLNMREYYWGQRDRAIPVLLERIASVQAKQKKYSEAIASTEKALSYYSKIYGPGTSDRIPSLMLLGRLLQENNESEKSFEQYKQALALVERTAGSASPEAAKLRLIMARQSSKLGWDKTTEEFYKASLKADQAHLGAEEFAKVREEYGAFLTKVGRSDEAKEVLADVNPGPAASASESSTSPTQTNSSSSSPTQTDSSK